MNPGTVGRPPSGNVTIDIEIVSPCAFMARISMALRAVVTVRIASEQ